ncbi:MAG: hypothetical protein LBU64_13900 [Planctomycetota bacterium]|jgi:hypothetical protein|nr:hypothetical protein [Planctomycetota bacterium]
MASLPVVAIIRPVRPGGTTLWASAKVMRLLAKGDGLIDQLQRDKSIRKLQHFCDGNFKLFMPAAVKREYGKTFGVHLNQIRLAGFFADGHADFIAMDWFIKKTQRNDGRMNLVYAKVDGIREAGQWRRVE